MVALERRRIGVGAVFKLRVEVAVVDRVGDLNATSKERLARHRMARHVEALSGF